ncbi:flagellar assembly peptidoglycan hydrolase FlgJ [Dasania sp. GY-MA-18]|uniref:Peptidoglycan hydrolase FlgJ n=1 Tax=Dasania phycosphaerae TaxID=2950436 RepID=A0A9J6RIK6_9GAMM|nr:MULTISPECIES: flagellar assembly peptidoglycan hydrolase FlgJ [Dasania]MCR8921393.1 flagellar assembly peptidoglycan hydrolase FlgJ [Dasania sp. GY-MA-18]MCZ0863821.1 flagellar assembly peptidoglycan hydrolase FlgJ [Dasania phycosphaerae]MCZ0867549.1 flagellar assembly peptidoglycan hydrolase FlgJ [Dasania phycosphaerae]
MMQSSALTRSVSSDAYTDLNSLNAIRSLGRSDKNAALEEVAKQFESMLVRMMMKSMRDANEVFAKGNMLSSPTTSMYQQMYDDQLAVSLTKGRGMGIGDLMVKQLQRRFGIEQQDNTSAKQQELIRPEQSTPAQSTPAPLPSAAAVQATEAVKETVSFDGTVSDFVNKLYAMAKTAADKLAIEPKALLAQAALETGWGKKMTQASNGESSLNLFNIKASSDWQGDTVSVATLEFKNNLPVQEQANFRSYNNIQQSFDDYVDFIMGRGRYDKALQAKDGEQYIQELAKAGYATDPKYAEKIMRIANSSAMNNAIASVEVN